MQLHGLQRHTKVKRARRVGRGGKRGKTSGRGHKGQKARAGHRIRPHVRDLIRKFPKRRGRGRQSLISRRVPPISISLSQLERVFPEGGVVNPTVLRERGLIPRARRRSLRVKIVGASISKKLSVTGLMLTNSARRAITAAGGTITEKQS